MPPSRGLWDGVLPGWGATGMGSLRWNATRMGCHRDGLPVGQSSHGERAASETGCHQDGLPWGQGCHCHCGRCQDGAGVGYSFPCTSPVARRESEPNLVCPSPGTEMRSTSPHGQGAPQHRRVPWEDGPTAPRTLWGELWDFFAGSHPPCSPVLRPECCRSAATKLVEQLCG